jgi:hypothetical protein
VKQREKIIVMVQLRTSMKTLEALQTNFFDPIGSNPDMVERKEPIAMDPTPELL